MMKFFTTTTAVPECSTGFLFYSMYYLRGEERFREEGEMAKFITKELLTTKVNLLLFRDLLNKRNHFNYRYNYIFIVVIVVL